MPPPEPFAIKFRPNRFFSSSSDSRPSPNQAFPPAVAASDRPPGGSMIRDSGYSDGIITDFHRFPLTGKPAFKYFLTPSEDFKSFSHKMMKKSNKGGKNFQGSLKMLI